MSLPSPDLTQRALLAEALQLSRSLLNGSNNTNQASTQQQQARLRQIRVLLEAFAHPICQTPLGAEAIPLAVRQNFVRAAVLVTRYQHVGGSTWQGTLNSPTLSQYHADPIPTHLQSADTIEHLCQAFALPPEAIADLKRTQQTVDRHIAHQKQIMRAVLDSSTHPSTLFYHLFGNRLIPPAAIDLVHTEMQIFFCLDYEQEQLRDPALWKALTARERSHIQAFLRSLKQFSFEQFQRFPVFGPCSPQGIDAGWCEDLAAAIGVTTADIIQTLMRSVGILPTAKAEAFLVHDIWGHHWQLMLTQFESDYAILTNCNEPLRVAETAYTPAGPLRCGELFRLETTQVTVDSERARHFFHGEVQQRLGLLFTHLIGELTADVAEFKFVWENPQKAGQLISSSLFKAAPTKLDLSLADVDFLFLQVLRPLLEMHVSVFEEARLETELLAEWAAGGHKVNSLELRTSLKQAIAQLYQIFLEEYNHAYLPTMAGETGIFTQIVSNLLYLQNAINTLYTEIPKPVTEALPFRDLLIVFIGCSCSSDSYAEFWAIDDVLAGYFLPCCHLLRSVTE